MDIHISSLRGLSTLFRRFDDNSQRAGILEIARQIPYLSAAGQPAMSVDCQVE